MVHSPLGVVSIDVALMTVPDRVVAVVADALQREADGERGLIARAAVFVLANHRHLLHRVNHVLERYARVLAVNGVGTLDAAVKRRRILVRVENADVVVVADLAGLRITGRRAVVALAHERNQIVVKFHQQNLPIEQFSVESRPVVE